jgi:oligopeptide/dipeptide ABC transporter ATP-binding protein
VGELSHHQPPARPAATAPPGFSVHRPRSGGGEAYEQDISCHVLGEDSRIGDSEAVYEQPLNPYTKGLLLAALPARPGVRREEVILTGEVPSPLNPPAGCRFHPRCPYTENRCREEFPLPREITPGHKAACHFAERFVQ